MASKWRILWHLDDCKGNLWNAMRWSHQEQWEGFLPPCDLRGPPRQWRFNLHTLIVQIIWNWISQSKMTRRSKLLHLLPFLKRLPASSRPQSVSPFCSATMQLWIFWHNWRRSYALKIHTNLTEKSWIQKEILLLASQNLWQPSNVWVMLGTHSSWLLHGPSRT